METFEVIRKTIHEVCNIDLDRIAMESTIEELEIDSLDFVDVAYELEQHFDVKLPVDDWMKQVNDGEANVNDYFVVSKLAGYIDTARAQRDVA